MNHIILRCSNASTLKLVDTLKGVGIQAWAPVEVFQPRARNGKKREPVDAPLLPSFVFSPSPYLTDLLGLARYTKPAFSVMRTADAFATVPERQLTWLRHIDRKQRATKSQHKIEVGQVFRMADGGFEGLRAEVIAIDGKHATILVEGWNMPLSVSKWAIAATLDATNEKR